MEFFYKFYKILILLFVGFLFLPFFTNADLIKESSGGNFIYVFKLYYDEDRLVIDRDSQFPYELVAAPYESSSGNFYGVIADFKNQEIKRFKFDPVSGKNSIKAPYYPEAKIADFYDNLDKKLLSIDVSGSAICDQDEVCESDVGENTENCSFDCKLLIPPLKDQNSSSGEPPESRLSLLIYSAALLIVIIIIVIVVWFFKRKSPKIDTDNRNSGLNNS